MSLFPKAFSYIRNTRSLVLGVWTVGTPQTLTGYGSIQPISGEDSANLEPATLQKGVMVLYTTSSLQKRIEGSANMADRVLFDGGKWEVVQSMPYTNNLIPHRKYLLEYEGPA